MKYVLPLTALLLTLNAFAAVTPALVCKANGQVVRATLKNVNDMPFEPDCADALFTGDVCFEGARSKVLQILEKLGDNDVFGDELRMRGENYSGRDNVRFYVWDGPNEVVATTTVLKPCR